RKCLIIGLVVEGAGNNSGAAPAFFPGREKSQFCIGNAKFIRRNIELPAQAIEGKSIHFSTSKIEEARNAWFSSGSSSVKLPCQGAADGIFQSQRLLAIFGRVVRETQRRAPMVRRPDMPYAPC